MAVGVTVIVEVMEAVPVFVPVNAAMFPDPLATSPIAVFEFDQVKVAPATGLVKLVAAILSPSQIPKTPVKKPRS